MSFCVFTSLVVIAVADAEVDGKAAGVWTILLLLLLLLFKETLVSLRIVCLLVLYGRRKIEFNLLFVWFVQLTSLTMTISSFSLVKSINDELSLKNKLK